MRIESLGLFNPLCESKLVITNRETVRQPVEGLNCKPCMEPIVPGDATCDDTCFTFSMDPIHITLDFDPTDSNYDGGGEIVMGLGSGAPEFTSSFGTGATCWIGPPDDFCYYGFLNGDFQSDTGDMSSFMWVRSGCNKAMMRVIIKKTDGVFGGTSILTWYACFNWTDVGGSFTKTGITDVTACGYIDDACDGTTWDSDADVNPDLGAIDAAQFEEFPDVIDVYRGGC